MKIQLASDLHLEMLLRQFHWNPLIAPAHEADVLVLAGDIANWTQAIGTFGDWPVPVLYVAGNHEFYGESFEHVRSELRRAAEGTSIRFLDNDVADFGGVRFLGATLWTDYRFPYGVAQATLMKNAERRLNDHHSIRSKKGVFTAAMALEQHEYSRNWLAQELAKPYDGKTVVITHHGPHPLSVHPRYAGDPTNAAFVSSTLEGLLSKADLWLHGHVHDCFDYTVHGCRVVANPLGYALNKYSASEVKELVFENKGFQWACVIDVGSPSPIDYEPCMEAAPKFCRVFIDTEFSNLIDMELISIGLVTDSEEFYAELNDFPLDGYSSFVQEAVLPHLGLIPDAVMSRERLCDALAAWLVRVRGDCESVVISYDYFGDYVLFVEALGEAPAWVHGDNIRDRIDETAREAFWQSASLPRHHALGDAKALRCAYRCGARCVTPE